MNNISSDNNLVYLDYTDLLTQILQALHNQQIFELSSQGLHLQVHIDKIATRVAEKQVQNPLGALGRSARSATVNISPGSDARFQELINKISYSIGQQLSSLLGNTPVEEFVAGMMTSLQALTGKPSLNFTYNFSPYQGLQKQRLTLNDTSKGSKTQPELLLKFHKLTISVQNIRDFNRHLQQGINHYIDLNQNNATSAEREDLEYILEDLEKDPNSDFYRLQKIVDTETLGKLKKQAQVNYLEFLLENVSTNGSRNEKAIVYLQDLIRRLKLIEAYIGDSGKPDGDYLVSYGGVSINYRDMFSRAEVYEILPIIPIIEGYLGENKDEEKGEIEFVFGIKLKFDGKVQALGGKNVFEYHLNLLNPDSAEHKAGLANETGKETFVRKVLKIAFLYYFVFASRQNPTKKDYNFHQELEYDPVASFDQRVLTKLQASDEVVKQKLFRDMYKSFQDFKIQVKINSLKVLLRNLLRYKSNFSTREFPLHISIKQGIVEDNIESCFKNNTLFKPILRGNPKENLKYIALGEAQSNTNALCTLPGKITFSDIHFFATDDKQTFTMEYDLRGINALPILMAPINNPSCKRLYEQEFSKRKLIVFPYSEETNKYDSIRAFIHQLTYSLLAYICMYALLEHQKMLFVPILRLHLHNKQDEAPTEKFLVSLSNVLSHLLNETHRSNSQGVDIRDLQGKGQYKIPNVMSSLYSILPKKFTFTNTNYTPQLDKLAIIVVSSRESDRKWGAKDKISNLMGEIIGLRLMNNSVRVQLLTTFSDNYDNQQLFTHPAVIVENVAKLYKMGYRHFAYIAKAPYTSTLHMTQTEEDDGLFFMSKDVVRALKAEHDDIKIYPMFFDKYYAIKPEEKIKASSLYVQDTAELTNLVEDTSKQSVVFFNLFNGISVAGAEKYYNGVISYATLLNIYKGILDDEDIRTGLMYEGSLKNDILQYLTLFHFSRYQKAKEIHLKLDPYDNLIGDNSVGKLATFNHMQGKTEFNSLAFLTLVRKVLNVKE
ncbi:hypothetical protein NIES4071_72040 [Calothrix sp. NIES-4071]|nr:hypothetical protein NIES4071_72040 [Calothrix sp. NIES-4071]BAZ61479.1 hypothetical protein NIES4105_71990 [Calothrix sp. NIES-4105]